MKSMIMLLIAWVMYSQPVRAEWTAPVLMPPSPSAGVPFSLEISTYCNHMFGTPIEEALVSAEGRTISVVFYGREITGCTFPRTYFSVPLPALELGEYRLIVVVRLGLGSPFVRDEQVADTYFVVGGATAIPASSPFSLVVLGGLLSLTAMGVIETLRKRAC